MCCRYCRKLYEFLALPVCSGADLRVSELVHLHCLNDSNICKENLCSTELKRRPSWRSWKSFSSVQSMLIWRVSEPSCLCRSEQARPMSERQTVTFWYSPTFFTLSYAHRSCNYGHLCRFYSKIPKCKALHWNWQRLSQECLGHKPYMANSCMMEQSLG